MNCGRYKFVLLDACFIASLYKVDATCDLMEDFGGCADGAACLYVGSQYDPDHCGPPPENCTDLDEIFSPEEAASADEATKIDFSRIAKDPVDPQMIIWAIRQKEKAAIFTCDKNLLRVCATQNIPRSCFKAALHALNEWYEGAIFKEYSVADMFSERMEQNPFFHFNCNSCCDRFCKLGKKCLIEPR